MPFKSKAQRRALYAKNPAVAREFEAATPKGKKLPEKDALYLAHNAVQSGAKGVDMGRNIFQSEHPVPMIRAVREVVHNNLAPEKAFELYTTLANEQAKKGGRGKAAAS